MKKHLIIVVAFLLIFTHIIPPYNISIANDEVNECETMSFTVQSIKENDGKIGGTAVASDILNVEYKTKNQTDVINVDNSGNFALTVEEGILELNDEIIISNNYFKVETIVGSEKTPDSVIDSNQYVECPVIEEVEEERAKPEVADTDEKLEEVIEETESSEERDTNTGETPDKLLSGKENIFAGDNYEKEVSIEEYIREEIIDEKEIFEINSTNKNSKIDKSVESYKSSGTLNLELLSDSELTSPPIYEENGKHIIELTHKSNVGVGLALPHELVVNFYLPSEIINMEGKISATYDIPGLLGLLGLFRDKGSFTNIENNGNFISMSLKKPPGLNIITYYSFTLRIELDELPSTQTGKYIFQSATTEDFLIDISLIAISEEATEILDAPPEAPKVDDIYSNSTVVTGTGLKNTIPVVTIEGKTYTGVKIDETEVFSVEVGEQEPDTVISVVLKHGDPEIFSKSTTATVIATTLSFENVPDNISFKTTEIDANSNVVRIPRQESNWTIDVNDTRGAGNEFNIVAKIDEPLTSTSSSHTLPGALVYVNENSESTSLEEAAVKVHSNVTSERGNVELKWQENQGIMIEVNPLFVRPETYSTTINWTLSNGP